jgi:hypothetical protein
MKNIKLQAIDLSSSIIKIALLHPITPFLIYFFTMLYFFSQVTVQPVDDVIFSQMANKYTLFNYVTMRYLTWSSRITTELFLYYFTGPLVYLWKWFCASVTTIGSYSLYKMITIDEKDDSFVNCIYRYICCFGFGLISSNIISSSVFWITGAINYLIPFNIGLIAIRPFVLSIKLYPYKPSFTALILNILFTVLAAFSHEQVLICLIVISTVMIYTSSKHKYIHWSLWLMIAIDLIALIIILIAPGDRMRFVANMHRYFPEFETLGIKTRFSLTLCYLMEALINNSYLILAIIWLMLGRLLLRNSNKYIKLIGWINICLAICIILRMVNPVDTNVTSIALEKYKKLFIFNLITKSNLKNISAIMPYTFWLIGIFIIPLSIGIVYKANMTGGCLIILYLCSLGTIIMMTLSPTMYITGGRGLYISNMLLLILVIYLSKTNNTDNLFLMTILIIAIMKLYMIGVTWNETGYKLWYGIPNHEYLPFNVIGR